MPEVGRTEDLDVDGAEGVHSLHDPVNRGSQLRDFGVGTVTHTYFHHLCDELVGLNPGLFYPVLKRDVFLVDGCDLKQSWLPLGILFSLHVKAFVGRWVDRRDVARQLIEAHGLLAEVNVIVHFF